MVGLLVGVAAEDEGPTAVPQEPVGHHAGVVRYAHRPHLAQAGPTAGSVMMIGTGKKPRLLSSHSLVSNRPSVGSLNMSMKEAAEVVEAVPSGW